MFQEHFAEQVVRTREREITRAVFLRGLDSRVDPSEERAVLSGDWSGWSWDRARSVLGTMAVAMAASVALPASIQGLAWGLREVLELMSR